MRYSGDYDFYSREEIDALVRAAASEQDAAIFLTAALAGLRRGVDFPRFGGHSGLVGQFLI